MFVCICIYIYIYMYIYMCVYGLRIGSNKTVTEFKVDKPSCVRVGLLGHLALNPKPILQQHVS